MSAMAATSTRNSLLRNSVRPNRTALAVVPAYNEELTIVESLRSLLALRYPRLEIIVVNDGSTDPATVQLLSNFQRSKTVVIHTPNQGLAAARNAGIAAARGKYILPLDADDKIAPTYLEKAVAILEASEKVGIVYCLAEFFGARSGRWELPPYAFPAILLDNCIFCTALFRRADWLLVGGYNPNMLHGWEDYDFWLSLIERGREVYRIPEVLFFYRKSERSMTTELNQERFVFLYTQLFHNHAKLYADNIGALFADRFEMRAQLYHARPALQLLRWLRYWKLRAWWHKLKGHN